MQGGDVAVADVLLANRFLRDAPEGETGSYETSIGHRFLPVQTGYGLTPVLLVDGDPQLMPATSRSSYEVFVQPQPEKRLIEEVGQQFEVVQY